jgi:hypothetical protein
MCPKPVALRALLPLLALAAIFVSACAGPGKTMAESDYPEMLVSLRDFRDNANGTIFELANKTYTESHQANPNADQRIQTGELLGALIDYYGDEGFWEYSRPGQGPLTLMEEAGEYLHSVLEVKQGSKHGWITFRKGLTKEELTLFGEPYKLFLALFNETSGYRSVQNLNENATDIFRSN